MSFFVLFNDYKIRYKGIRKTIFFGKLPRYRKICIVSFFAFGILGALLIILKAVFWGIAVCGFAGFVVIIFCVLDLKKKNMETMLEEHYKPYSKRRMNMMIHLLDDYHVTINNKKIDLLISEAKCAQSDYDYISKIKKPIKLIAGSILPLIVYCSNKIGEHMTLEEIVYWVSYLIVIIVFVYAFLFMVFSDIKDLLLYNYNMCDEFIYDLRQIKIFYHKKNTNEKKESESPE
ncbi:MAG: hypothetical protein J5898_07225 [Lachnospiraceae bacterium]|nr:hypothetical protein [Lachnospiraceae bacterium]